MTRNCTLIALFALLLAAAPALGDPLAEERQELERRLAALEANEEGHSPAERLAQWIDLSYELAMFESPEFATYVGDPRYQDRWSDWSLAGIERQEAMERRALALVRSIDRAGLDETDRLSYDLLLRDLEEGVAGQRFPGEWLAISQMGGVQQNVAQMLAFMPARTVPQLENILARLRGVPALVDATIARLERGLEVGVTPPRVTLRDVPQQVLNILPEDPLASPLLRPFANLGDDLPAAERERLTAAATEVYREQLAPAYRRLHQFLTATYLPGARESVAMSELPDGQEWYAHQARQMTTTDLTPLQIHEIGQREVKRIRGEMDRVIAGSGFEGSFEEFLQFLRSDPQFYFTDEEELLRAYRDIAKRADPELVKLFGRLPRLPYGVVPVPEYAEKSQTTAYYEPGSPEAGRPGNFYANTYDLPSRPKWEMEALTLHEAVPGHHLQIALAQELEEMPWFRRWGGETAFVEGWGLYAESLGEEMGFYQDPYSKFGQLTYEMWRAVRLVVDTGMHAMGWSREQAIDFFKANAGKAEHDIVVEIDRYIVWPGQALAYKMGELKLKELRAFAEQRLGDAFDIRAFHDQVLGAGALPLDVLDARIRAWVAEVEGGRPAVVTGH